ncbi:EVE domain-containing protein [Microvirga terricola]|uniref:UPF0310 protein HB375_10125 n=1 Tax=Microvirga terricola TaxID=2719797 RepID=A0ABX0VBT6_9HYPH|nr:EVE domain-containing protein [Microvirga terricola]
MSGGWIAVASAEHVRRGREGGFMQVCHGKAGPLRRIKPGDHVAYYSPTAVLGDKIPYRAFTAVGVVAEGEPYAFDMGGGFIPSRRNVRWFDSVDAPIVPLLERLDFTAGMRNWGYKFRFGLFAVSERDMDVIADALKGPADRREA